MSDWKLAKKEIADQGIEIRHYYKLEGDMLFLRVKVTDKKTKKPLMREFMVTKKGGE